MKAGKRTKESIKKSKAVLSKYMGDVGMKDLSDDRKAAILAQDFAEFQKNSANKLGMQIGVRIQIINTETEFGSRAIMVPVKLNPENEAPIETPEESNQPAE